MSLGRTVQKASAKRVLASFSAALQSVLPEGFNGAGRSDPVVCREPGQVKAYSTASDQDESAKAPATDNDFLAIANSLKRSMRYLGPWTAGDLSFGL